MTLQFILSREAQNDIAEAVAWFGDISPDLSIGFGVELDRLYSLILEHPRMYPVVYRNFRRALLRRFPYSVFYVVEASAVLVVGVIHQSRDDAVWRHR